MCPHYSKSVALSYNLLLLLLLLTASFPHVSSSFVVVVVVVLKTKTLSNLAVKDP